MNFNNF